MTYNTSVNGAPKTLERRIGLADSVFLVIGAVFGSGIFLTTGVIAAQLPSPGLIWFMWIAGGMLTVMGALTYAELGVMYPESGGPYIYLREAFGDKAAFVFGWTFFWIISGGGLAALAMGFAEYVGSIVPAVSASRALVSADLFGQSIAVHPVHLVAVASILLLTGVNAAGIRTGVRFQNAMTVARLAALAAFIVLGFSAASGAGGRHLVPFLPAGPWPSLGAVRRRVSGRDLDVRRLVLGQLHGRGDPETVPDDPLLARPRDGRGHGPLFGREYRL